MALLKRVDWHNNEIPYTEADRARYAARLERVRGEVAEIRTAAEAMAATGGAFLEEAAAFLTRQARYLQSANEHDGGVELQRADDTAEDRDGIVTEARQALLLARAWQSEHSDLPEDSGRG